MFLKNIAKNEELREQMWNSPSGGFYSFPGFCLSDAQLSIESAGPTKLHRSNAENDSTSTVLADPYHAAYSPLNV